MIQEKYFRVAKDITPWKINNKFENFLAKKADKSEFWKKIYNNFYKFSNPKYFNKGIEIIKKEIKENRPYINSLNYLSDDFLIRDMVYCLHRFGVAFHEYFMFEFYNLNYIGRVNFTSLKLQYGYCEILNKPEARSICDNKINTYRRLKRFFNRDVLVIDSKDKIQDIEQFIKKNKKIILKPANGHSGLGVKIISQLNEDIYKLISNELKLGGVILEELISQHHDLAVLHPQSINTIRIFTFSNNDKVNVYGTAIRMGRGDSIVDNVGSGGIYALIDEKLGIISSIGGDKHGERFIDHPDTKIVLPGFKIPEWDKAIKLTKEMSKKIPEAALLAWDLAYSINGWELVEVNDIGDTYLIQFSDIRTLKSKMISLIDETKQI